MVTDSGRFQYSSTTPRTMHMAATLLETGLKMQSTYNKLYNKSFDQVKFSAYVKSNMELDGKVAHFHLEEGKHNDFNVEFAFASASVHLLMGSTEAKYGMFSSVDPKNNVIKVSLRSKSKPVSPICEKFGGGGHQQACGIKLESKDKLIEVLEELKNL